MSRKTTSIKMDEDLWKKVRIHCVKKGIPVSDYIEELLKKDLAKGT